MNKELDDYFHSEKLPSGVWSDKYALQDKDGNILEKTPNDMHWRLANEFARIEQKKFTKPYSAQFLFDLFKNFSCIIPQGSPMFGIGNPHQTVSLSNCYVLTQPLDSYNSILAVDKELVNIAKRRGGNGIDLSNLRPAGTATNNAAKSSTGVVSFAERYSNSTREVGQKNRRGALMLTLDVHHPESIHVSDDNEEIIINDKMEHLGVRPIKTKKKYFNPNNLDFCSMKLDRTKVTGANISIKFSDEFLKAVDDNVEYEQRWPVNSKTPKISKMVSAVKAWEKFIHSSWQSAEPGVLFWDRIINESPADCYKEQGFETTSTNPCLPGWGQILTRDGIRTISDIKIGDEIWSKDGWTRVTNKWSTGIKDVYQYKTTFGHVYCTENHELVQKGKKVQASNCDSIDLLRGVGVTSSNINVQDVMDGCVFGDGMFHKASDKYFLIIGDKDYDYFDSEIAHLITRDRAKACPKSWEVISNIKNEELVKTYDRRVPVRYMSANSDIVCGFLRGLFSANGTCCGQRVSLKTSSPGLRDDVQLMLSSIGIASYITTNKAKKIKWSNGEYVSKESYDVNITRDLEKFSNLIGFLQKYKTTKLKNYLNNKEKCDHREITCKNIIGSVKHSTEEVFDITVDNQSHTFWYMGFNVSNCGELPLCALDSCRLLILNLLYFVRDAFLPNAFFDFKDFVAKAKIAQRLMDDLVDLELECVEKIIAKIDADPEPTETKRDERELWLKIKDKCSRGRRTGLGITALGDTLAALNIKYGSEESITVSQEIYRALKLAAYESSVEMAEELGPFEIFDHSLEKDNPFLKRFEQENIVDKDGVVLINGKDLYAKMKRVGRKNISLLTTAPTGSTSLLARASFDDKSVINYGTSSGIEPVFMLEYKRRRKMHEGKTKNASFTDQQGDSWEEFTVYHPTVNMLL